MSARTFAQINTTLLRSKKIRECSHSERWAYLCAHLTPLGSFTGLFEYPLALWARDAGLTIDDTKAAIHWLVEVGLIEFDHDEEIVRIVGFHRQRPPANASQVISQTGDLFSIAEESEAREMMRLRCIAEFAVAAIQRAQQWKPDSPEHRKLRDAHGPFLAGQWQEHGDVVARLIDAELMRAKKATRDEMASLFSPLLAINQNTSLTPCLHSANTVPAYEDEDGEKTKTERRRKK